MSQYTGDIDKRIRVLAQSLKMQLDFAAAADMNSPQDQIGFAERNHRVALSMIALMKDLGISMTNDADVLEKIAAVAEKNGSNAGDLLKIQAAKVRAINTEAALVAAQKKTLDGNDLNTIFRKHLKP
jgi:hypothetical protein